jgi:hypothetical protein
MAWLFSLLQSFPHLLDRYAPEEIAFVLIRTLAQVGLNSLVSRLSRPSLIVMLVGALLGIATAMMALQTAEQLTSSNTHDLMSPSGLCS